MLYRLSVLFGEPVEDLEHRLTAQQLINYQLYYELEPWGCEADDYRFAQLAYITAQANSQTRLDPNDYLPPWRKPKRKLVPYAVGAALHTKKLDQKHTPRA